jgi:hypothetical protein
MDKKFGCIYTMETYLCIKQGSMIFTGNCTELEKNKADSEKQILNIFSHMWNHYLKKYMK